MKPWKAQRERWSFCFIYRDKSHNKQQTVSLRGGREVIRGGKVSGSPFFLLLTSRCRSAATETSHAVASLLPFILFHLQTSDTREPNNRMQLVHKREKRKQCIDIVR